MPHKFCLRLFAALSVFAVMTTSCGGNGSNDSNPPPESSTTTSVVTEPTQVNPPIPTNTNTTFSGPTTTIDFRSPADRARETALNTIAVGFSHTCAVFSDGNVACWGDNNFGQLGDSVPENSHVPLKVSGISKVAAVGAGDDHTCVLHQDGTASCWGNNEQGQLGMEVSEGASRNSSASPTKVQSIHDAVFLGAGGQHTCIIHESGAVSCWGNNNDGQLGNISRQDSDTPVLVLGISDAQAIDPGLSHTCALLSGGEIACWGNNETGQLGNGTTELSAVAVRVPGITDAIAVATGDDHSCALHRDGTVSCWGNNDKGQVDPEAMATEATNAEQENQSRTDFLAPRKVTGINNAVEVAAGWEVSCVLQRDDSVTCWGQNTSNQLGRVNRNINGPVKVSSLTDAIDIVAGGGRHNCLLRRNEKYACWGLNSDGQLGIDSIFNRSIPANISPTQTERPQ